MPSLASAQDAIRRAILEQDGEATARYLVGGMKAAYRLSIHQRHYTESLARVIARRFPVLVWLVGESYLLSVAREYCCKHPPLSPVLIEYGGDFPEFLARYPAVIDMPWLVEVGQLEWRLTEAVTTTERASLSLQDFAAVAAVPLERLRLRLQSGLSYMALQWSVDDLVKLYLTRSEPERFVLSSSVQLELLGRQGSFVMRRIDEDSFAFRQAVLAGCCLADALRSARTNAGELLARLFAEKLVVGIDAE